MAYLSEANTEIYRRMLSDPREGSSSFIGVLPPGGIPSGSSPTITPSFPPSGGLFTPRGGLSPKGGFVQPIPQAPGPISPSPAPINISPGLLPKVITLPGRLPGDRPISIKTDIISPTPSSFSTDVKPQNFGDLPQDNRGQPKTFVEGGTAASLGPQKTNFMPLVYIGGAGLLLYFLFKK